MGRHNSESGITAPFQTSTLPSRHYSKFVSIFTDITFWVILSTCGLATGVGLTWLLHRYQHMTVQLTPEAGAAAAGGPLISVIMPVRNEARNLGRSAPALLAQTYPNLEIIVVDDGSTDATPRILASLRDDFAPRVSVHSGRPLPPG